MIAHAKNERDARLTPEEYLKREYFAETKSEYHDGIVVAMAGASPEHNRIAANAHGELHAQLRGSPCQAFVSDMRVRVPRCNKYYYPDIVVVCGEPQYERIAGVQTLLNPTLIIEVLSDSTEEADRKAKFDCYWTLDSLMTYVLIAQDSPRIETFTRQQDGSWRYQVANNLEAEMTLETIACTLKLRDVYARVEFPQATVAPETNEAP